MSDLEMNQLDCEWVANGEQCPGPAAWVIRIAPVWEFKDVLSPENCSALLDKTKRRYLCEDHKYRAARLLMTLEKKYIETQIRITPVAFWDAIQDDKYFDPADRIDQLVDEAIKVVTGSEYQ
jgi:hypothetical protein